MPNSRKSLSSDTLSIGGNLRYLRQAGGFSMQDIAQILGVSYQQVQKYENGLNRFPLENLYKLKKFYDVPYDVFFRDLVWDPGFSRSQAPESNDLSVYVSLARVRDRKLKSKIEKVIRILLEE